MKKLYFYINGKMHQLNKFKIYFVLHFVKDIYLDFGQQTKLSSPNLSRGCVLGTKLQI